MKDKKGTIIIPQYFIDNNKDELLALFSKFIPVYIDGNFFSKELKYSGFCNEFKPIGDGSVVPEYDVIFTRDENSTVTVSFKEK